MPSNYPAQRRELGEFLRAQRARLTPAMAGIGAGTRRRTPGLRREEIAQLCGISATWYSWVEQGRDVSMSAVAFARLARVLRLSPAERGYLFELAGKRDPDGPASDDAMDAPPAIAAALGAITAPAYVLDRVWNARAWNSAASRLFVGWLDDPMSKNLGSKNLLRYVFLAPAARSLICDWEDRARRVVAEFRADAGARLDDPWLGGLVRELAQQSALFAESWDEHAVVAREGGERTFRHPEDGFLKYRQIGFNLASQPSFKLVMLVPAETNRQITDIR